MKKTSLKKWAIGIASFFLVAILVLVTHIYLVTRPRVDANTRILARIDIGQPITSTDAGTITKWLYAQKSVDHVLCNNKTSIVVFTYSPLQGNANEIAQRFSGELHFARAKRFMPSADQLKSGCPVAPQSFSYKAYKLISKIF